MPRPIPHVFGNLTSNMHRILQSILQMSFVHSTKTMWNDVKQCKRSLGFHQMPNWYTANSITWFIVSWMIHSSTWPSLSINSLKCRLSSSCLQYIYTVSYRARCTIKFIKRHFVFRTNSVFAFRWTTIAAIVCVTNGKPRNSNRILI